MNFSLSLGLFSSSEIDAGTRYLLNSLALQMKDETPSSLLDIGCGVGTIAISLKKRWENCDITARDRDALACAFTLHNSQVNKTSSIHVEEALFLEGLSNRRFDLIVSNIPAKAGEPVIRQFINEAPHYCNSKGRVAIVLVSPLRALAEQCLKENGAEILFTEHGKMYSIFHFRAAEIRTPQEADLSLYFRNQQNFLLEKTEYPLTTAYNLPDFDQISWKDSLSAQTMKGLNRGGTWFFMNPGQGHQLCYLLKRQKAKPQKIILCSRDLLQIKMAAYNARQCGFTGDVIELPLSIPEDWENHLDQNSVDFAVFNLEPVSRTEWEEPFRLASERLLKPEALYMWLGRSSDIQGLMKNRKGSSLMQDKRSKAWRSVILKKNPSSSL